MLLNSLNAESMLCGGKASDKLRDKKAPLNGAVRGTPISVRSSLNKNVMCDIELSFSKKCFVIALFNMAPTPFPPLACRSEKDDGWLRRHGRVHHPLRLDHWSAGVLPAA